MLPPPIHANKGVGAITTLLSTRAVASHASNGALFKIMKSTA